MKRYMPVAALAFLYFCTAQIFFSIGQHNGIVTAMIFPSEGIALAFVIYYGKWIWPGIFIGQFFIAYFNHMGITPSLLIASINSAEAVIAVTLFNRWKLHKNLSEYRDFILFAMMIVFILQPFSAVLSNFTLLSFGIIAGEDMFLALFHWWFGNVMGQLLYAPFLLTLFTNYKQINFKEYLLIGAVFGAYTHALIGIFQIHSLLLMLILALPIMIYIVYRRNIAYGFFLTVISSNVLAILGESFIASNGSFNVIDYDLYVLTSIVVVFTSGIIFDNQKKQKEELKKIIAQEVQKNKQQQLLMLQQNRLAQLGEMISMIAHQWRQPINNLALMHQFIYSKYKKDSLDDKTMEYFKKNAKLQVENMSQTIDDFRNFFKPQESKKEFFVSDVIEQTLKIIAPLFEKYKINIEVSQKTAAHFYGYQNALGHILVNILNNAKDALLERNIKDKKIKITVEKREEEVVISISDNAGGVDESILDKIFDPYFSTKNEKNGTGLGLYMAQVIALEYLNAQISVHNSEEGAVFTIILKKVLDEKIK